MEHTRSVGRPAHSGVAEADLDDESWRDGSQFPASVSDVPPLREVRIHLHAGLLVGSRKELRDLPDGLSERFTGSLDVPRVGGDSIEIPHLHSMFDFFSFRAVEEEFHFDSYRRWLMEGAQRATSRKSLTPSPFSNTEKAVRQSSSANS